MSYDSTPNDYLKDYYKNWVSVYKEGAIREVTLKKYHMTQEWLNQLAPDLTLVNIPDGESHPFR